MPRISFGLSLILSAILVELGQGASLSALVRLPCGPLEGIYENGLYIFKGIPYAQPPIGPLRWQPPQPVRPWTRPRAAKSYGPACPQAPSRLAGDSELAPFSEDCLYLNIWTPARDADERLPVMCWIHGGGFVQGSASRPFYEGSVLARHGVVVVTINYRLGAFGFFVHPDLRSKEGYAGNWGLLDQVAALRWIRDNIPYFGGDPNNVTIFGESAGATSVHILMASPLARGLFHRAIAQSGAAPQRVLSLAQAEEAWQRKAAALGITDWPRALSVLRQKDATELVPLSGSAGHWPGRSAVEMLCLDGRVLTEPPAKTFTQGRQAPIPFLVGSNADEGALFARERAPRSVEAYQRLLRLLFGPYAAEVLRLYPAATDAQAAQAYAALLGDMAFTANARRSCRWHAAAGYPVWRYFFDYAPPWAKRLGQGATHGSEIPFIFGIWPPLFSHAETQQLSEAMISYWTAFARTGEPRVASLPPWERYDPARDNLLVLANPIHPAAQLRAAQCDLWDRLSQARGDRDWGMP